MPFCGFNKQMLDGLKQFHLGLVKHGIIERSKNKHISTDQVIQNELNDMTRFLKETSQLKDVEVRELVEKLTQYAEAFYRLINKRSLSNYEIVIQEINSLYFEMDRKYYTELEGRPNDMKLLAQHLNTISV